MLNQRNITKQCLTERGLPVWHEVHYTVSKKKCKRALKNRSGTSSNTRSNCNGHSELEGLPNKIGDFKTRILYLYNHYRKWEMDGK